MDRTFFGGNRRALLKKLTAGDPNALVVLFANGQVQRNADNLFEFRQDSSFWYFSGCEQPDFTLIFDANTSYLVAPKRMEYRDQWEGPIDFAKLKQTSGVGEVLDHQTGWAKFAKQTKTSKQNKPGKQTKVHTLIPSTSYIPTGGFYVNPGKIRQITRLKRGVGPLEDCTKIVAALRQIKQSVEIAQIQRAVDITNSTLSDIKTNLDKFGQAGTYTNEREIAADLYASYKKASAMGHSFEPVVACGKNAATIHYKNNDAPLIRNSYTIIDTGAEVSNYAADISRTFAIGQPTKLHRHIHQAVTEAQQYAIDLIKPGQNMKEYEKMVRAEVARHLKALKLIDDLEDTRKINHYFPFLTSHHLGLDVHDMGLYDGDFQPGMVITAEPGIHVEEQSVGVRIEDDILVTKTGARVLSKGQPADLSK